MILSLEPSYPSTRRYVLRLHREAASGHLVGRLESVSSGRYQDFGSAQELLACLERELAAEAAESPTSVQP